MTRRTTARVVWLILSGLLIATGLNVALRERPFVSILIAVVFVGGCSVPLITWGGAAKALTHSDPEAAEVLAALRKELTR